jgi:hypothetical protein
MEEHVFGFFRADSMTFPVLGCVPFIPLKPGARVERVFTFRHQISISLQYTRCKAADVPIETPMSGVLAS